MHNRQCNNVNNFADFIVGSIFTASGLLNVLLSSDRTMSYVEKRHTLMYKRSWCTHKATVSTPFKIYDAHMLLGRVSYALTRLRMIRACEIHKGLKMVSPIHNSYQQDMLFIRLLKGFSFDF